MDRSEDILQYLRRLNIPYVLYEHEPKETIEACQQETAFYLVLLRHDRAFRTAVVSKLLGVSRLSFAKSELLPDMLGLEAGAVSPLGLVFDTEHRIQLGIDSALLNFPRLLFHPGVNHRSVELAADDFFHRFLPACGHQPQKLSLSDD